ncbi:MAG: hypothetical protein EA420_17170 [Candidatus Competibacteraceae bacterium]|nr:MAG: hypothetical protein EA420_17170 [Candidatus Competibacteraceae bacterium]
MPFPGGGADKVGNRYELRWTVRQFIRLLKGDATWIHLEPIGAEGERVEFRLGHNDGRIEVHQVKRQQANRAHWTVADLDRVGVLEGVRKHTVDGGADFVFVSTQAPKSLPELRVRAEIAPDFPAFQASLPPELQKDFDDLQYRLFGVNKDFDDLQHPLFGVNNDQQTWRTIRQSRWIAQDERELDDTILALLGAYLTGDPQAALGVLAMFALDAVHRRITPQDLWGELEREGILPSDIARDKNLVVRLRQCREDYLQSQEFTIGGLVLPQTEADTAVAKFRDPTESKSSIFLVGPAGVGKTGVAGQIVQRMAEIGWLVLPLRFDRLDPTQRPVEIGQQLFGREKSPVAILAGLAAGGDCLLVIEQLDAVSVVSGRRPEVFYAVDALVREARAYSNMRLLLVCRAFDLDHDQRLRDLRQQEKIRATSISVGLLDPVQVKEAVAHLGLAPDRLTPGQIELLRLPLHLALLAGMTGGDDSRSLDFVSPKDLYDTFWRRKRTDLLPMPGDQNSFEILLYALCDAINDQQALLAPRGLLPSGDADLDRLVSAHVLVRQGSRIGFFHEGFFDYVFARRFCEMGEPLLDFLRSAEQDLFRRSQVRQILAYRRDDDFDAYLDDLRNCLAAPDIRFHIKKLMIGVVGQVSDPRPEEWAIFKDYLQEWTGRLADSVRSALWSPTPWFRFLHDQGVLATWLASDCSETRTFGFHWLSRMVESEPNRVADLLEGLAGLSQEQDDRVLAVVTWSGAAVFSERIETLFHRLATQPERDWTFTCKAYQGFINTYCYHPNRGGIGVACRALGCWLRLLMKEPGRADLFAHDRETQNVITEHQLAELAKRAPEALVEAAMEPFRELLEHAAVREGAPPFADRIWHPGFQELTHWAPEYLLVSLVDALKQIAVSSPDQFSAAIDRLRRSECRTAHGVLLRALAVESGGLEVFRHRLPGGDLEPVGILV